MFPNKSSSYAISSKANAFVQNFKVEGESTVVVAVGAVLTEPVPVQPPISCSAIPTNQVPDSTTDVTTSVLVDGVGAVDAGVNGNDNPAAPAVEPTPTTTTVHMSSSSSSNSTQHAITIKCSHTGCEPSGYDAYPCTSRKSEAVVGRVGSSVGAARGKGGSGAGPLLLLARFHPISLHLSVIITSSTITRTCSSWRPPPSLLSFVLQVPNAMIADVSGNSSNSNSLSAQKKHHTVITIPHITSQANSSQLKSDKFGAPYFQDENDNNNNYNNNDNASNNGNINDDYDDEYKICERIKSEVVVCVNDDDDDDDDNCKCGCHAAAEKKNIPMKVKENDDDKEEESEMSMIVGDDLKEEEEGGSKKSGSLSSSFESSEESVAAEEESFKNHCDHNDNFFYNNTNNNDNFNSSYVVDLSCKYEDYARRWGIAQGLKLAGGGESSLNNSANTGWGSSAGGGGNNSNNNNANSTAGTASWGSGGGSAQQQQQQQNNNSGANNSGGGGGQQTGSNGPQVGSSQWGGNSHQTGRQGASGGGGGVPATSQQQQQAASAQQNNSGNSGMKSGVSVAGANNQSPNAGQSQQQQANVQNNQQPIQNQQNNNQQQQPNQQSSSGNSNQQQQPQNGSTSWAAAAGKGLASQSQSAAPGAGAGTPTAAPNSAAANATTNNNNNSSTKQQLEQLNTMRESLFSLDGWGGQNVNQDSSWDIPASPEPSSKDNNGGTALPVWKPNINNGTELWEANLRNGGQPPPVVAQKTPWGHTPSSNLGGTWGEDDDIGDASNVWTGVPSAAASSAQPPPPAPQCQWPANNSGPAAPIWGAGGARKKEPEWGGGGSNWDHRPSGGGGGIDPRDMHASSAAAAMVDPRDHMRVIEQRAMSGGGSEVMMRGGGMSGRLNNAVADQMWGAPPQQPPHHVPPHHQPQPPNKMGLNAPNAPVNQWPGPPPKEMGGGVGMPGVGVGVGVKPSSGWEEPSPPAQRRNIPNYDDGTSLWGAQQQRNTMPGQNKVSHWKEMPSPATMGRGSIQCPPGIPQAPAPTAMPVRMPSNIKSDAPLWGHTARNGSWEGGHEVVAGGPWGEEKISSGGMTPWNEPPWGGQKPKNPMNPSWVDGGDVDPSSWGHPPKQPLKPLTKEIVWASKQFRMLSEMGFKKEDVENALRTFNMSLEDALEYLNNANRAALGGGVSDWRSNRHADMDPSSFDHPGNTPPFAQQRFNPQQMPFPQGGSGGPGGNGPSQLNSSGNSNLSNITPAIVQKILQQPPPPQQQQPTINTQPTISYPMQSSRNLPTNQPSAQQLRVLVQQIQLAVTTGYLNHQILNQPLAPQTLLLLNQLLQQIKVLQQQQHTIQQVQNPMGKGNNTVLALSVQITKTKQQITNLQNQISAQQAIYVKQQQNQQQQQQHHMSQPSQADFFKPNMHDPLSALQSNFADISIKESQSQQQQQSRLSQWKLPSLPSDKDDPNVTDFSRAPGTTTKPLATSSPNPLNPLLSQPDTTWSVGRSSDTGWPDSGNDLSASDKEWPVVTSASQAFTDLVPEFEPGKPWKGNQMKSIEDDPSITPGSVAAVQSPISLPLKDDIFSSRSGVGGGGKTSPTTSGSMDMPIPSLSLSSSTWSFQPTSSSQSSFNSPLSKMGSNNGGGVKSNTWGDQGVGGMHQGGGGGGGSELWSNPKPRQGPPPGLSKAPPTSCTSTASNGWGSLSGRWGSQPNNQSASSANPNSSSSTWGCSTWLLLKNLTPQIDGSTLKTLCVQHGPLQNFHMYLSRGIAFVKYNTREEATKAQGALNNCVLGNTTIFADIQPENDILTLLHTLSQQSSAGGGGWSMRGPAQQQQQAVKSAPPPAADTWGTSSQLWGNSTGGGGGGGSSLWGTALDAPVDPHRTTPSSLNSFLPPDLLGGESM